MCSYVQWKPTNIKSNLRFVEVQLEGPFVCLSNKLKAHSVGYNTQFDIANKNLFFHREVVESNSKDMVALQRRNPAAQPLLAIIQVL